MPLLSLPWGRRLKRRQTLLGGLAPRKPQARPASGCERAITDHRRRDAGPYGLPLQVGDLVAIIGNAASPALRLVAQLGLAGDQHLGEAGCWRAGAHARDQGIHALPVVSERDEQVGL